MASQQPHQPSPAAATVAGYIRVFAMAHYIINLLHMAAMAALRGDVERLLWAMLAIRVINNKEK